jgi:hypothetical protein
VAVVEIWRKERRERSVVAMDDPLTRSFGGALRGDCNPGGEEVVVGKLRSRKFRNEDRTRPPGAGFLVFMAEGVQRSWTPARNSEEGVGAAKE